MTCQHYEIGGTPVYICQTPVEAETWVPATDIPWADHDTTLYCEDCCCKMLASECVVHRIIWGSHYYGPTVTVHCADGFGCKANPRRMFGMAGRRYVLGDGNLNFCED